MKINPNIKPDRKGRFFDVQPWQEQYNKKKTTAREVAAQVRDGDFIFTCGGLNFPRAFIEEMCKRILENKFHIDLFAPYCIYPDSPHLKPELKDYLDVYGFFTGLERKLQDQGNFRYIPCQMSDAGRVIRYHKPRMGAFVVSPPNEDGWMSRSVWTHHYGKEAYLDDSCEAVIVEVNRNMPFLWSDGPSEQHTFIHVSEVDYIIETDYEIREIKSNPPGEADKLIAGHIAELIPNGACLQIGLGGLSDAVTSLLVSAGKKDLGLWSEIISNGLYALIEAGVLNNSRKNFLPGKSVVATCIGDRRLFDWAANNPDLLVCEGAWVNDIRNISRNDNLVSVNTCLEIDLQGQVSAEAMGYYQYSGTGGQLEFVIGSQMSKGGKSILCLQSTFKDKQGKLRSKIKPILDEGTPITTPRSVVQWIVTEYGAVNLRYESLRERARKLISIAHPQFREELTREAAKHW
ncbi:MAG TPA: acetyl-CoA hydrolase/transferase C-terminal domain-containing protein [Smithellaceae bacterium]|mgnify:CR=1 FL=1|jgi:acyl-CoA hydrolase|nr:MAG: Succinyl-CoA:coenzyme A transferase [Deltaproteobacteria bacterium ADurb.Bin022]HOE80756.1 acetyl-CoA hydrolase/transferase C-terminal domain-containing protein [Smithellaceae bacterium]HQI25123.1 acetyl-CoA hydrolase/transferase C-terminal domain-containing protein [Smithella sp.]HQK91815.1 acetyl-CoA hydrolase/transferase C-terminal domain-containing protein [Smithellaceae bacterium]